MFLSALKLVHIKHQQQMIMIVYSSGVSYHSAILFYRIHSIKVAPLPCINIVQYLIKQSIHPNGGIIVSA